MNGRHCVRMKGQEESTQMINFFGRRVAFRPRDILYDEKLLTIVGDVELYGAVSRRRNGTDRAQTA